MARGVRIGLGAAFICTAVLSSSVVLAGQADLDRRAALAAVAQRAPTAAELAAVAGRGNAPEEDAAFRRFATFLESSDPVARRSAYDVLSGVFYCQLKARGQLKKHRAIFASDPVLGAKCDDGHMLAMRKSSLDALQEGARFVAGLTGAPTMSAAEWRKEAADADAYLARATPEQAKYFALAATNNARAMSLWNALGRFELGQSQRTNIVASLKEAKGTSDERLPLFYALVENAWAKSEPFVRFNARLRQAWKDTLWMADKSLENQTIQSGIYDP